MNKAFKNFLLTLILAFLLGLFLPWWSILIASISSSAIVRLRKASTFVVPFLAITVLWASQAYFMSSANDFILAKKIAVLLPLGGNAILLILVTGIIGGIAGGVAGVFGNQLAFFSSKNK